MNVNLYSAFKYPHNQQYVHSACQKKNKKKKKRMTCFQLTCNLHMFSDAAFARTH